MATTGPGSTPRGGEELKERILEFWNSRFAKEGKAGGLGEGAGAKGGEEGGAAAGEAKGVGANEKEALVWALGKLPVSLFPRISKSKAPFAFHVVNREDM